tara:strand:- start:66 stop:1274 length:1209 start_codon:yes stop_codon:yes gene_type:complete
MLKLFFLTVFFFNIILASFADTKWIKKKKNTNNQDNEKKIELVNESKDTNPPKILINDTINVDSSSYEIEGKLLDESKKLFIILDNDTIEASNGVFKIKRFSPVDEQIEIVAIDQWGNKSSPKIINIVINSKEKKLTKSLEPLNPSKIKSINTNDKVGIIIGIDKYEKAPSADFANMDAKYFYEYLNNVFGISDSNLKLLINDNADLVGTITAINKWLPGKIKQDSTELFLFFAGHGLASTNGEELFLLSQDSDPDLLNRTALSRKELFETILDLKPKSVTMFFDTCFSGISRDEQTLLASARPIRIIADEQNGIPENFTIFSASQLDQISSGLDGAEHGIFSYYLMKGLEGNADLNKDKKITNSELLSYMDQNVSNKALELGREQNPSLAGDPNKVLISYR